MVAYDFEVKNSTKQSSIKLRSYKMDEKLNPFYHLINLQMKYIYQDNKLESRDLGSLSKAQFINTDRQIHIGMQVCRFTNRKDRLSHMF